MLTENPESIEAFREWCERGVSELEAVLDDPTSDKSYAAALVSRAKVHAYRLTAYDLADVLPARDEKNPVDALLRLRECLAWIESGGPDETPTEGPLTVAQAARLLNVSQNTVYRMCESGDLAHHRIGDGRGTIRITRDDLQRFLARNRVESRPSEMVQDFLGL